MQVATLDEAMEAAVRKTSQLSLALMVLAGGISTTAVLGPLVLELLEYRTSELAMNQIEGGDLAALVVVVPTCLAVAALARAAHPAAPVLALAPGSFAVYTYSQLIMGNEYLDLPGNVERFFPLLLGVVLVGAWVVLTAWSLLKRQSLPATSPRYDRFVAASLFVIAGYVAIGIHVVSYLDAVGEDPTDAQYLAAPTAFWVVKLWDLAVVVPAALVIGIGMLRHRDWARRPMYALLGGYLLLACAVCGMAWVMHLEGDPGGSLAQAVIFTLFVAALAAGAARLYEPLFRPAAREELVT